MPLSTIEYSTSNIPAFLSKLWTLVEDKKYDELIAWDPVITDSYSIMGKIEFYNKKPPTAKQ
jgi:hypothetical protein